MRCARRPNPAESSAAKVHVVTDVFDLDISLRGGEIDRADLTQYPLHKDTPNVPVRLENDDPASLYLVRTGLTGGAGEAAPSHLATFTSAETSYTLADGATELRVPLTWTDDHGLTVTKTFVFKRGALPDRPSLRCAQRVERRALARLLCADPAPLGARLALVFRRRDLFLQGSRGVRRQQIAPSQRRERHREQVQQDRHGRLARGLAAPFRHGHRAAPRIRRITISCRSRITSSC